MPAIAKPAPIARYVAVWVGVTFSSYHGKAWNVVAFGAFIGFLLVILIMSISLMRRPD